ncbi:hypothetical protein [Tenacibaculum aiptasiae]|uniref:hypothetical protein n=1 Tax=Tenacibaculum aiptasiae TaxID=426481 RepID=UPI003B5CE1C1
MNGFEYEISGISNINRILPSNGNWYYRYLKNGNVVIHGTPSNPTSFSSKKFAQKITINGGYLKSKNNIINKKHLKMADNETKKASNATDQSKSTKSASTSLETLENEINQLEEAASENNISKAYSKIELTSTQKITNNIDFQNQLDNNLGGKINTEAKTQIKQLIEQIKKEFPSETIISAVYTPPSCKSNAENIDSKGASITISKSDCKPATLSVTTEVEVDEVKVSSIKKYPISESLFSTEDITNALAEFTTGRTFLKGLTTATQTFTQ